MSVYLHERRKRDFRHRILGYTLGLEKWHMMHDQSILEEEDESSLEDWTLAVESRRRVSLLDGRGGKYIYSFEAIYILIHSRSPTACDESSAVRL